MRWLRESRSALPLLVPAILGACGDPTGGLAGCGPPVGPPHQVDYALVDLPDDRLWYRGTALQSFDNYPQDEDGVVLYEYDGQQYYNPVSIAQRGMWFADNYRRTGDTRYLERARAHADRLLLEAHRINGALYLPYAFEFRLHGGTDLMENPWYSGMAQGQALSLFLRLHEMTGHEPYMDAAHDLMPSFHLLHGEADPYVARIDCEGYYWIEEYPQEISTGTLNGFIFGVWGVYEYWRATGDEGAERLVKASLATLKRYLPDFRVPGEPSLYCLKHRAQYELYHTIHIQQLEYLHRLSGDPFFPEVAELFLSDAS
jgi:hypothetical protein